MDLECSWNSPTCSQNDKKANNDVFNVVHEGDTFLNGVQRLNSTTNEVCHC